MDSFLPPKYVLTHLQSHQPYSSRLDHKRRRLPKGQRKSRSKSHLQLLLHFLTLALQLRVGRNFLGSLAARVHIKTESKKAFSGAAMETRIVPINKCHPLGKFDGKHLENWIILPGYHVPVLEEAASLLKRTDIPVAFPTETVYGLGADATRSGPVKGIYKAKGRPSDNPLIVHVCDLLMLRSLLRRPATLNKDGISSAPYGWDHDPIPPIYGPLIKRFWPGPLTILLRQPPSMEEEDDNDENEGDDKRSNRRILTPEVTAGLGTFGARMPNSTLALSLIKITDAPLAAPSANASTRPSPTTAQHVKDDLDGRIELILDGGSCQVGVESTVVDGLCNPPVILRPGGLGIDVLRECPGWELVETAYNDKSEMGGVTPKAPGMKYKHYSPKAKVILYEHSAKATLEGPPIDDMRNEIQAHRDNNNLIGMIRTREWNLPSRPEPIGVNGATRNGGDSHWVTETTLPGLAAVVLDIDLGRETKLIAHGLFSALRELDRRGAGVIFVEGIDAKEDISAAIMNRLRKAATEIKT